MTVLLLALSLSSSSQNADIRLLRHINLDRNEHYDGFFKGVTHSAAVISYATPVLLYGAEFLNHDSVGKQKAIYIGATLIAASAITVILKYAVDRPRPFITYPDLEKLAGAGSPSFPSGHTSDAFALATSLSISYPKWYVIVPSYAWAGTVGYSRMHLGVHYPSDVLAGALIGAGSAYLCHKGQQWLNRKR